MWKNALKIGGGLLIAGFFLWLALRHVELGELFCHLGNISYGWLPPYILVTLLSHYLRAERWKLLINQEGQHPARWTLFTGVMLGYMVNYAIPRLGEISRSVYVGKKERISGSNLMGTVVFERGLDLLIMIALVLYVVAYIVVDPSTMRMLLGEGTVDVLNEVREPFTLFWIALILLAGMLVVYAVWKGIKKSGEHSWLMYRIYDRVRRLVFSFIDGLFAIRRLRNWPAFVLLSAGIWLCYILLTYLPFHAFNLVEAYGLGLQEALTLTAIASIGVALPSPGGIGTYHWFMQQGLFLLYAVPLAAGLAFSIVTHGVMMLTIILVSPLLMLIDNEGKLTFLVHNKQEPG